MSRILIVEDEEAMRLGLVDNLQFDGHEVDIAENGELGLEKIRSNKYDLVLLDVMLPKMSGFDVCKTVRKEGNTTPIILLTARGEEIDKVLGLELGADDYVTKPFSLRELLARIRAVLRRGEAKSEDSGEVVQIGKVKFDFSTYSAFEEDKPLTLTTKEFDVIHFLWKNRNNTVSRDDLLDSIWGKDVYTTSRTIDNFILKLRQKIEINPNEPKKIITVHGIGYKLIE